MKFSPWYIVGGIALLIGAWMWTGYNGLVTARAGVDGEWAQVETNYQRRFDLIPNLVNTVRGASDFEQDTLTAVTAARTQWMSGGARQDRVEAADQFEGALARLIATVESYPQLAATQAYRDLMTQLEGTENRISTARRDYNLAVRDYNVKVMRFPGNLLASIFGFEAEQMFEADQGAEDAPVVDFDDSSAQ